MAHIDVEKIVKEGVEQAMKECELTIGMTLKEAVEKQKEKKVVFKDSGNRLNGWFCPTCDKFFGYQYINPSEDIWSNYCPDCGQALDWEVD